MSRNEVAVGTVSESVMFATKRAAGPVMGLAPGGAGRGTGDAGGVGGGGGGVPLPRPRHPVRAPRGGAGQPPHLPIPERLPPLGRDRARVAEPFLVHHLHEGGVMGPEDEFAHALESNVSYFSECLCSRLHSSSSNPQPQSLVPRFEPPWKLALRQHRHAPWASTIATSPPAIR